MVRNLNRFRSEGSAPVSRGKTFWGFIDFFYCFFRHFNSSGSFLISAEPFWGVRRTTFFLECSFGRLNFVHRLFLSKKPKAFISYSCLQKFPAYLELSVVRTKLFFKFEQTKTLSWITSCYVENFCYSGMVELFKPSKIR